MVVFRHELAAVSKFFPLKVVQSAARKALLGLGDTIKNPSKLPFTCLKKLYLTGSGGAGRVIFLIVLNEKSSVLVMIRHKHDKKIGANMGIENPKFKAALEQNLHAIAKDLQNGSFQTYEL